MDRSDISDVIGSDAYDPDGEKVGRVGHVYLDDETDEPAWAAVNTGFFGTSESLVPLTDATIDDGRLNVAHSKSRIKGAPSVGADGHLTPDEEADLYAYYGREETEPYQPTETSSATGDASASATDDAMTRSEEQLRVETERAPGRRARMRKYVVTEQVEVTVPVRREKVVLETEAGEVIDESGEPGTTTAAGTSTSEDQTTLGERQPATSLGDADNGPEVVLHEERPVVTTETVPVERARLRTEEEIVEQTVTDEVQKERVEVETDRADTRTTEADR